MHRLSQFSSYWSFSIVTFFLLLAWKPSAAVVALCHSNQSTALLRFKQGLSLQRRESLISWRRGTDCCNWKGITCEKATGFVIRLKLRGATLEADDSSRIDPSIFRLSRLRLLDLSQNQFEGPIPSRLVELRELTHLNLSYNIFSGQIPPELFHMTWLVSLDLSHYYSDEDRLSNLHLSADAALQRNLNSLRTLHLDGINISTNGADCFTVISLAMPNLRELSLSGCSIFGPMNDSILQLKSLSYLDLSANNFPSIPNFFWNLKSLRFLNLSACSLRGTLSSGIFRLPYLQILDVSDNPNLQGSFPDSLAASTSKLQVLSLHSTGLIGGIPDSVGNLSELRVMKMSNCNFTGSISLLLSKLVQLQVVDLSLNNLNGQIPPLSARTITHIDLHGNSLSGPIPKSFSELDGLARLSLQINNLSGQIPPLSTSTITEIDLFANAFSGPIPESFGELDSLVRLSLRNNNFSGHIPLLSASTITQIDLSGNSFSGPIPKSFGELDGLESLSLQDNLLSGPIPSVLLNLPSLKMVDLSNNSLTGSLSQFTNASSLLESIDLSHNFLGGEIPTTITSLSQLYRIALSFNHFSGTINVSLFMGMKSLLQLDLFENRLTFVDGPCRHQDEVALINSQHSRSCNIHRFRKGIRNQWLWGISNLNQLNLSHNMLTTWERATEMGSVTSGLRVLDLHSNLLSGDLSPLSLDENVFLDNSSNRLTTFTPLSNFSSPSLTYLSISNNKISGMIPELLCSTFSSRSQSFIDLSNNNLVGSIPYCLISSLGLSVLDLSKNQLSGPIPNGFGSGRINCSLATLKLNGNQLSGRVPISLSECGDLEVLDLSNNELSGEFPSWLGGLRQLRVLSLHSNNFYGSIVPPAYGNPFPMLQILDVSSNSLGGTLEGGLFRILRGMMKSESHGYEPEIMGAGIGYGIYYKASVSMTIKGKDIQMDRMLRLMTSIDLSSNHFTGEIPSEIGTLDGLVVLNISNNDLVGQIPQSLATLLQLESLDLSRNNLSGNIPAALCRLTFLSVLNLSFNNLQGQIPQKDQLLTFEAPSFEGNPLLCGPPLTRTCTDTAQKLNVTRIPKADFAPLFIAAELGLIAGLACIVLPVFLVRRVRWWWYGLVDTTIKLALRRLHVRSCILYG